MSLESVNQKVVSGTTDVKTDNKVETNTKLVKRDSQVNIQQLQEDNQFQTKQKGFFTKIKESVSEAISNLKEKYNNWKREEVEPATRARNAMTKFLADSAFGTVEDRTTIPNSYRLNKGIQDGTIEEVTISNSKGDALKGHFHKADPQKDTGKVVLFLSGSSGPAEKWSSDIAEKYKNEGISTLAVNYRGFGQSGGVPSENGLYKDAKSMFDHLVKDKGIDPKNIIIHGFSLGGPVAAELVKRVQKDGNEIGGLFLDRPMPSMSKAATAHMGGGKLASLAGQISKSIGTFSIDKKFDQIQQGTKVVLMTDDDTLGPKGDELRNKLNSRGFNVEGNKVDGLGHENSYTMMNGNWDKIKNLFK